MRSITRTLTFSLSLAATAIFLVALNIVMWLDLARGRMKAPCEAGLWFPPATAPLCCLNVAGSVFHRAFRQKPRKPPESGGRPWSRVLGSM